jgi:hypothetical protein
LLTLIFSLFISILPIVAPASKFHREFVSHVDGSFYHFGDDFRLLLVLIWRPVADIDQLVVLGRPFIPVFIIFVIFVINAIFFLVVWIDEVKICLNKRNKKGTKTKVKCRIIASCLQSVGK